MSIILFAENGGGQPAGPEDCERWADQFGLTFPVLADPGWGESNKYEQNGGIPTFHLLGRDLTIRILDGYPSAQDIQDALDEPIPEVPWDEPPSMEELAEQPIEDDPIEPVEGGAFDGSTAAPFGGCSANVSPAAPTGLLALLGLLGIGARRRD